MPKLTVLDVGRRGWDWTWRLQERLVALVGSAADAGDQRAFLVLVEHSPAVITLGRGGKPANIVASPETLAAKKVEVRKTTRGGDVTYHGPGQLVAYPIIRVDRHGRDVRKFVHDLEEVVIRTISRFGVAGQRRKGLNGVWIGRSKISAVGVSIRRWVSCHGVALNVGDDLSGFELIVPCGLAGAGVTSLSRLLDRQVSLDETARAMVQCFIDVFGFASLQTGRLDEFIDED